MILVAGGTGFIGAAVVRELVRRGKPVAVLSTRPEAAGRRFAGLGVEIREGDARDPDSLERAVVGMEAVVSSMTFPNFPVEDAKRGHTFEAVDARGNEWLSAAAAKAGVRRYVYLSGAGAAEDAQYHWYRAKWRAEQAIQRSGLGYTIVRPSWVYGPEDRALNRFVGFARRLPFVPVVGDGRQRLQPVFVNDVVTVVCDSLDRTDSGVYEIGGPDVLSMDEVIGTMLRVMGKRKPLLHAPAALPRTAGALMSLLPIPNKPLSPDAVTFITMDALADTGPLLRAYPDLRLTPLEEGLRTYLGADAAAAANVAAGAAR